MGIDHDAVTVIGFSIDADELLTPFLVRRNQQSHLEKRFSPKTGREIEPERIIDVEEGYDIIIAGEKFPGPDGDFNPEEDYLTQYIDQDICKHLSYKLDCQVDHVGDFIGGDFMAVTFEPHCLKSKNGRYPLSCVADAMTSKEFDRIRAAAKKIGINLGEPSIHSIDSIS